MHDNLEDSQLKVGTIFSMATQPSHTRPFFHPRYFTILSYFHNNLLRIAFSNFLKIPYTFLQCLFLYLRFP